METAVTPPTFGSDASTTEIRQSPTERFYHPVLPRIPRRQRGVGGKRTSLSVGMCVGHYEILSRLGVGGMGEVYRARDRQRGGEVAVKVPRSEAAASLGDGRRFDREARAAAALHHPNTVAVHEVNVQDGVPYIVMELVEGKTLRDLMRSGPLPTAQMMQIVTQVAHGLVEIHAAGIVHRDLKPANIMVTATGLVKILDFGLVRCDARSSGQATEVTTVLQCTQAGVVLGTAPYMSPEQASGGLVDCRSDQFSLGATLYEMATGRRAFRRETTSETLAAIIAVEPEPVEKLNDEVPQGLVRVIGRCLAKDPGRRYASTRELKRRLDVIARRQAIALSA